MISHKISFAQKKTGDVLALVCEHAKSEDSFLDQAQLPAHFAFLHHEFMLTKGNDLKKIFGDFPFFLRKPVFVDQFFFYVNHKHSIGQ
jgi:hypothetical protein